MYKVLGRANSSNVMKVLVGLDLLEQRYERTDVGGAFGGTDTPEYRALNPNRVVPTLVEPEGPDNPAGPFVLWESNVILRYLAARHGFGTPFWPEDLRQRANIERWMDWQHTVLGAPMTVVFWGLVRTPPEKRDGAAIDAARTKLEGIYGMLDAQLTRHPFVAGVAMTPADIAIGVHARRWLGFEMERPALPAVEDWFARMMACEPFARWVGVAMT